MEQHLRYSNGGLNGVSQNQNKVRLFDIILDKNRNQDGPAVYSSGEVLTGTVRLDLEQSLSIKAINILVQGTGSVLWKKRTESGEQSVSDDEVYLNEIAELVGKGSNEMVTLSAGEHLFPFACDLPEGLPDSFRGSHGSVSYIIKAIVEPDVNEQLQRESIIEVAQFSVTTTIALEEFSSLLKPYRIDHRQPLKSGSLSFNSKSVKVSIVLPRRAFAKGESIIVTIDLTNCSRKQVRNMGLGLIIETKYNLKGSTTSERILVADIEDEHVVKQMENRKWRDVALKIPPTVPCTNLPYCNLISLRYLLVFKAEIIGDSQGILLQIPVAVGVDIPPEMASDQEAGESVPVVNNNYNSMPQLQQQREFEAAHNGARYHSSLPQKQQQQQPRSSQSYQQQPLEVQVDYDQLWQGKRQEQNTPSQSPGDRRLINAQQHDHNDSQVISMRFSDELDDAFNDHSSRVTNNPLFQQQQQQQQQLVSEQMAGQTRSFDQQHGRFITAFNASISSGVNENDVLY